MEYRIFTLGTSNRSLREFLTELGQRNITQLIDVRSVPFSRLAWFSAPQIERWSEWAGVLYRQEGAILGGRSNIRRFDPRYDAALSSIAKAAQMEAVAIFCAEGDPANCHRSWSIGAVMLQKLRIDLVNILRDGTEELMSETLLRARR